MAKILVVDDEPDIRSLVVRRLTNAGHRTREAGDAASACALVESFGLPDVAVLDVSLPDTNGMELLHLLRTSPGGNDMAAIFLTGRMQPIDIETGRALGARYLTKPFVANALLTAIDDALADLAARAAPVVAEW